MYQFESYTSDTIRPEAFVKLEEFLRECESSDDPAAVNMGWQSPAGFLYNVKNQLRWRSDQGCIFLVIDQGRPIALSCVEFPEGSYCWAVGGVRTWITPSHRSKQVANFFLNKHLQWAAQRNCSFMLLTFNDYNRAAWTAVAKDPKYRRAANWSDWWDDCLAVPEKLLVRSVYQWCVVKPVKCLDNTKNIEELIAWTEPK